MTTPCAVHSPAPERLRTPAEARAALDFAGVSVAAWAKAHQFKPSTVAAVLRGDRRARIGESHKIAVALRIKAGEADADAASV